MCVYVSVFCRALFIQNCWNGFVGGMIDMVAIGKIPKALAIPFALCTAFTFLGLAGWVVYDAVDELYDVRMGLLCVPALHRLVQRVAPHDALALNVLRVSSERTSTRNGLKACFQTSWTGRKTLVLMSPPRK